MSTYVISDLHGQYKSFLDLLSLIKFSYKDKLYILGDVIDRGPESLKIIDYIRRHSNIELIRGNHEEMLLNFLLKDNNISSINNRLWIRNGGATTLLELKSRDINYIYDLALYLESLPYYIVLDKYILTHAGVYIDINDNSIENSLNNSTKEHFLWSRDFINGNSRVEGYTVICGHTPIQDFATNKFFKRDGAILIDCGCASGLKPGCLRLEDLTEFYLYH